MNNQCNLENNHHFFTWKCGTIVMKPKIKVFWNFPAFARSIIRAHPFSFWSKLHFFQILEYCEVAAFKSPALLNAWGLRWLGSFLHLFIIVKSLAQLIYTPCLTKKHYNTKNTNLRGTLTVLSCNSPLPLFNLLSQTCAMYVVDFWKKAFHDLKLALRANRF